MTKKENVSENVYKNEIKGISFPSFMFKYPIKGNF